MVWRRGVVLARWEEVRHDRMDRFVADRLCIFGSIEEDGGTGRRMRGWVGRWVVNVVLGGTLFRRLKDRLVVGWTWINNVRGLMSCLLMGCLVEDTRKSLKSACERSGKILNEEE